MLDTQPLMQRGTRRPRSILVPAVIAYVVATAAFAIWRGISVSPDDFILVLLVGAIILGRWKAFLVDWMPFLVLFLGYEFLRGLAGRSGIAPHYTEVIAADQLLGGGTIPTIWLQQRLYHAGRVSPLDITATVFYFAHFAYPLTLGYVFWIRDRRLFRRFAAALLVMSFAAFVFFLLVPVAPPWLAATEGYLPHVEKIINHTLPSSTTPFYQSLNPNKVAAMPSLHAAFPLLGMLYGFRLFGRRAWPLALWVLGVTFSIVYLGEHYIVDAFGGFAFAAVTFVVVEAVKRRLDRRGVASVEAGEADPGLGLAAPVEGE